MVGQRETGPGRLLQGLPVTRPIVALADGFPPSQDQGIKAIYKFVSPFSWQSRASKLYSNSSTTISGFDPSRSGGPHVPAPLEVKTCIFPIRLKPYTNRR